MTNPTSAERRSAIKQHLRSIGCTCKPEIRFPDGENVKVAHDNWCPLLARLNQGPSVTFYGQRP